jgi:hypothetical protein
MPRIPRDAKSEALTAVILNHQRCPIWVVTCLGEDWADVGPRLDLANERYAVIFQAWENIPLVQVYATAELTGLSGPSSRFVFLPRDGAIAWLGMMRTHPDAGIGACGPWADLLAKLRTGRQVAAVPTV